MTAMPPDASTHSEQSFISFSSGYQSCKPERGEEVRPAPVTHDFKKGKRHIW